MTIKLLDWRGDKVEVDVGNIENIGAMRIEVITGDEILRVLYKDFTIDEFDSSYSRVQDYYDGEYEIYNATTGRNLLEDERFINRTGSYWFMEDEP